MNPARRALWLLENRLWDTDLDLETIAHDAMVSKFHLSRSFRWASGMPVMGYLRARRLSEAARRLGECGVDDLLDLALHCGYTSHEAFSRAFRRQFGLSPSGAREQGVPSDHLLEAHSMSSQEPIALTPTRFERRGPIHLIGLLADVSSNDGTSIPAQWGDFATHLGDIPARTSQGTVGALFQNEDESIEYLCAVEVERADDVPAGLSGRTLAPQHYAVFRHDGHVSGIRDSWHGTWSGWLPGADVEPLHAPALEVYGDAFDPASGLGGLELWIPVSEPLSSTDSDD